MKIKKTSLYKYLNKNLDSDFVLLHSFQLISSVFIELLLKKEQ